jgi:hypothetical protein
MDLIKIVCRLNLTGLGYGSVAGFCEHGNEYSWTIKTKEFQNQLNNYYLFIYYAFLN